MHMAPGSVKDLDHVWRNFGPALDRYRVTWILQQDPHHLGLAPIRPGFWCDCPACHRTMTAANSDACLGLVRLAKAAKSEKDRLPMHTAEPGQHSLWVPDETTRANVILRHHAGADALPASTCCTFEATKALNRPAGMHDITGAIGHSALFMCI